MRAEERKAAVQRLVVAATGLLIAAGLVAVVYLVFASASAAKAISAGLGVVGLMLVGGGIVALGGSRSTRKVAGSYVLTTSEDRRGSEALALGLLGAGIAFSVAALLIG